jgi:hypothetical protein
VDKASCLLDWSAAASVYVTVSVKFVGQDSVRQDSACFNAGPGLRVGIGGSRSSSAGLAVRRCGERDAAAHGHAKEAVNRDVLENCFSNPESSGYEIDHGKLLKRGRYAFPVVLMTVSSNNARVRRRFSTIIIVNTGNSDWAVDKLP